MKSFDYEAVVYDGEVYCIDCVPDDVDGDDVSPIFADDEVSGPIACCVCDTEHDYMTILATGEQETTDDAS